MNAPEQLSLGQLLAGLASDISGLFRKELQLAKAEATEGLSDALAATKSIAIGGILALGALGVLLAGIVSLLSAILVGLGMSLVFADAVAAVVVAAFVGLIAWSLIKGGIAAFESRRIAMDRTTRALARDAELVKEKL